MRRVRFAPSPTGSLHVGNALTAAANRAFGDWMLLRIDDTDPTRNVAGGEEAIVHDLGWLGIVCDEGPVRQSDRQDAYREAAETLGGERFSVAAGDTVCIAPGTPHCIANTGDAPLKILCACSPAYSHADTELLRED